MSETQNTSSMPTETVCDLLELLAQQLRGRADEKEGSDNITALLFPPDDDMSTYEEGIIEGLRRAESQVLQLRDTVQVYLDSGEVSA